MTNTNACDAKILIIDDQEPNLRLLERILRQGGYTRYRSLTDPREALHVFADYQPDLILLDLMMPHLDGVAVMAQLHPLTEGTYLPVVILTADATPGARRRALAGGAKDFLSKPFDATEVLLRIKNLLETRLVYQQLARRAEIRIREQASLLDRANDAILVQNLEGQITYWNQGAERMYGWPAAEALGRSTRELLSEEPAAELEAAGRAVVADGKWAGELRQRTREGREVLVASRWSLVRDEAGQPQSLLIIASDITERRKLEAQLAQAHRLDAVGRLAGGVAHDFNNLLTVIIGSSEFALFGIHGDDPAHGLIQDVIKAGNRAAELTRQLLAFSRRQMLKAVVMDLNGLVDQTDSLLRRLLGTGIELTLSLAPGLGAVKADPGQIGQVLVNLVVNARDAMPDGGRLVIETSDVELDADHLRRHSGVEPGPYVLLSVRDTGSGIDEATLARIFEPFFTTKPFGKGTGLGLATVHGIVKQSGGFIVVASTVGHGATFKVYLPRCKQEVPGAKPQAKWIGKECASIRVGTETILLAEDEDGVRTLGRQALEAVGYTVLQARDGEEALGIFRKNHDSINLLVTDLLMPKMSGHRLAVLARAIKGGLKILYLSGRASDEFDQQEAPETDIEVLEKPFVADDLVRRVREVLGCCGQCPTA